MTITTKQARELRKLITKMVNAELELAWKGSQPPEEHAGIEERSRVARKRLHEHIEMLKLPDGRIKP